MKKTSRGQGTYPDPSWQAAVGTRVSAAIRRHPPSQNRFMNVTEVQRR